MRNTGVFVYDTERKFCADARVISTEMIEDAYVIDSHIQNTRKLAKQLYALFGFYEPSHVFAEFPHGGAKSSRAAVMMSLAIGSVVSVCACTGVKLVSLKPSDIKHLVRAKGKVDKTEVREVVIRVFGEIARDIKPKSKQEHVYDAAGAFLAAHP
jgi:Holliday junction resolvasome RuvABC endonuclease subunit